MYCFCNFSYNYFFLDLLDNIIKIGALYSNIGWYVATIAYLRIVQEVLLINVKSYLKKITFISGVIILLLALLWVLLLFKNIEKLDQVILSIGITELFMFIIIFYLKLYLEFREYTRPDSLGNSKFISLLKTEEETKEKFAEYLHDDILQSIIAVKNITQISQIESNNKRLIIDELNNLVTSIRNEINTQKPVIYADENLKTAYDELVDNLLKKYKTNKKINFYCMEDISIYPPYSSIVYRIIKELINNGIKHSSGYYIELYLDIEFDNIYIKSNNLIMETEIKVGNGLDGLQKKVNFLRGKIDFYIENGDYYVEIVIPMERRICFENIINR